MSKMPQLVIFFYINQFIWIIAGLIVTIYALSTFLLPLFVKNNVTRTYISKL